MWKTAPITLTSFLKYLLFYVFVWMLECLYVHHKHVRACRGQKGLGLLEQELEMVMSHYMGAGNKFPSVLRPLSHLCQPQLWLFLICNIPSFYSLEPRVLIDPPNSMQALEHMWLLRRTFIQFILLTIALCWEGPPHTLCFSVSMMLSWCYQSECVVLGTQTTLYIPDKDSTRNSHPPALKS